MARARAADAALIDSTEEAPLRALGTDEADTTFAAAAGGGGAEPAGPDAPSADALEPISVGEWAGEYPNFGCPLCDFFRSLDRELVVQHIRTAHGRG